MRFKFVIIYLPRRKKKKKKNVYSSFYPILSIFDQDAFSLFLGRSIIEILITLRRPVSAQSRIGKIRVQNISKAVRISSRKFVQLHCCAYTHNHTRREYKKYE